MAAARRFSARTRIFLVFLRTPTPRAPPVGCYRRPPAAFRILELTFSRHRLRRDVLSALRLVAFLLVATAPGAARATDNTSKFALSWTRLPGAAACIPTKLLAARVESRLRRSVFGSPSQADVAVEGYVAPTNGGWRAVVSIVDASGTVIGTRELESQDATCRDLDAPIALTIALFIDPSAELSSTPGTSEKETASLPAPSPRPSHPRSQAEAPLRSWATLGGSVSLGLLPRPAPGLLVRLGVVPTHAWPIVLDGAVYREELQAAAAGAQPIGFSVATGGAAVCPIGTERHLLAWRACAGLDAGVLSTQGLVDDRILVHHRFIASGGGRLEGMLYLGHFLLAAAAGVSVPLVRDSFEYERDSERSLVFRPSPVGATFDLSLGYRSP